MGPNEVLPWENETHHGLFFIEFGMLRIEHSADYTTNKTFPSRFPNHHRQRASVASAAVNPLSNTSIGHLNARSGTMGRQSNMWKNAKGRIEPMEQNFRLARIGPGWVVGMIEKCSGMRRAGVYVAGTCIVSCVQIHPLRQLGSL